MLGVCKPIRLTICAFVRTHRLYNSTNTKISARTCSLFTHLRKCLVCAFAQTNHLRKSAHWPSIFHKFHFPHIVSISVSPATKLSNDIPLMRLPLEGPKHMLGVMYHVTPDWHPYCQSLSSYLGVLGRHITSRGLGFESQVLSFSQTWSMCVWAHRQRKKS